MVTVEELLVISNIVGTDLEGINMDWTQQEELEEYQQKDKILLRKASRDEKKSKGSIKWMPKEI